MRRLWSRLLIAGWGVVGWVGCWVGCWVPWLQAAEATPTNNATEATPPSQPDEAVTYAPLLEFRVELQSLKDGNRSTMTERLRSITELDGCAACGMSLPIPGFQETRVPADIAYGGTTHKGERWTWTREDPLAALPLASLEFEILPNFAGPPLRLYLLEARCLHAPPGTVRVTGRPLPGKDAYQIQAELTPSAPLVYAGNPIQTFLLTTFDTEVGVNRRREILSNQIPGYFCGSLALNEADGSRVRYTVQQVGLAQDPPGIQAFPAAGFGFAPPPGFTRVRPTTNPADTRDLLAADPKVKPELRQVLVAYRSGNQYIQIQQPEAAQRTLAEEYAAADAVLRYEVGTAWYDHLAGAQSYQVNVVTTPDHRWIYAIHQGRRYKVALYGFPNTTSSAQSPLRGWRWIQTGAAPPAIPMGTVEWDSRLELQTPFPE